MKNGFLRLLQLEMIDSPQVRVDRSLIGIALAGIFQPFGCDFRAPGLPLVKSFLKERSKLGCSCRNFIHRVFFADFTWCTDTLIEVPFPLLAFLDGLVEILAEITEKWELAGPVSG